MNLLEFNTRFCCIETCENPHFAYGMCNGHYDRCYRTGELHPEIPLGEMKDYSPFYGLVERLEQPFNNECVGWEGSLDYQKYGICWVPGVGQQRVAHLVLEFTGRPRPTGTHRYARYRCHNIICINPNHLAWSTPGPLKKGLEL